jgi:prepilin-type N-terminal cleavage/methylation domain-containing protein
MKNILLKYLLFSRRSSPTKSQEGFSLIEMMVVTIMIGILLGIAATSWDSFTTRQRIRTVNDQVFQVLRSAQSDAKLKKENMNLIFRTQVDSSIDKNYFQYSVYADNTPDSAKVWKTLDGGGSGATIKPGQIQISAYIVPTTGQSSPIAKASSINNPLIFNYQGTSNTDKAVITVTTPNDTNANTNGGGRRCIKVETLLGGMRSDRGSNCIFIAIPPS